MADQKTPVHDVLRAAEWAGVDGIDADSCCPVCREWHCTGKIHKTDCALKALLDRPDPVAVLTTLEWSGSRGGIAAHECCPDCGAYAPTVRLFAGARPTNPNGIHNAGCSVALVLGRPMVTP